MWCFVHFDFEMCFAPQRRALFQHPNLQKWREHLVFCTFWLQNVLRATTACTFSTSQLPKVVRTCDFKMCFAPQRRALFRHLNFQKWSEPGVFCTFWLQNVLRATTACTFSTSQLPKVVQTWCVLYILTSKCASRCNGVHFFDISTSKSGPNLVCFVHFDFKMCFAENVQSTPFSDHFWQLRCRKVHAVVARSTFGSQNVRNTRGSDHFWKFRSRKSARHCGAKHISKSKCKNTRVRTTFGGSDVASLRFTRLHYITLHYTPLHYTTLHYTTLHNTTTTTTQLHSTTLHSTTLNYTTLHYITLHSTTLQYTTLHYTTLPSTRLHYNTLHYTPLHYNYTTTLNYTPLHSTTLHYTPLH